MRMCLEDVPGTISLALPRAAEAQLPHFFLVWPIRGRIESSIAMWCEEALCRVAGVTEKLRSSLRNRRTLSIAALKGVFPWHLFEAAYL